MKNRIHALVLVGLMISFPIHAESKAAHYSKKAAKVAWYAAEIATGSLATAITCFMLVSFGKQGKAAFKDNSGQILPNWLIGLQISGFTIGSAALLGHGFSGLNKELEIIDRIKRLYEKRHKAEKVS